MIDVPVSALGWMLAAMVVSSGTGLALSRYVPWSDPARQAGIPRAFAFALAPFLLGLMAVFALGVFRGASHAVHLWVVFAGLLVMCAAARFASPGSRPSPPITRHPIGRWDWILGGILAVWVIALMVNTALLPLLQNDSLEYATVGRLLFDAGDLMAYPAIQPDAGSSGFYGPWTHPPLYVGSIYLAYVFQNSGDIPGLMRIIAPWYALMATQLIYSLGCMVSRSAGILSALIFLSVPLFFVGAGTALIDALPVLGMTLAFAVTVGIEGTGFRKGLIQGVVLGLGLWTHSQAILFVPLIVVAVFLFEGHHKRAGLLQHVTTMLAVAVLIAGWPYYRNFQLYGTPISDNPAVFAMPELAWKDYFAHSRGIDSWLEKIQYGILKGWFSLEAFSITFWLMTLAVVLHAGKLRRRIGWAGFFMGTASPVPDRILLAGLGVIVVYHLGVALSGAMGIDLMIRNERYLLSLSPLVALWAGSYLTYGSSQFPSKRAPAEFSREARIARIAQPVIAIILVMQAVVVVFFYQWMPYLSPEIKHRIQRMLPQYQGEYHIESDHDGSFGSEASFYAIENQSQGISVSGGKIHFVRPRTKPIDAPGSAIADNGDSPNKLGIWPQYRVVEFMRAGVPPDAIVLSLRPADMYYSGRRMISYLDPRLIPFYAERDPLKAWHLLQTLRIDYVHVPDYDLPPLSNSVLIDILGRPDLAKLVFWADGYQLFALSRSADRVMGETVDITPGMLPWTSFISFTGGRKALSIFGEVEPRVVMRNRLSFDDGIPIFQRDRAIVWISGIGVWSDTRGTHTNLPVQGGQEHLLDVHVEGQAYVQFRIMQLDSQGRILQAQSPLSPRVTKIGDLVLGVQYPERRLVRRLVTHPDAAYLRIGVEHMGSSKIRIVKATLTPILEVGSMAHH